MSESYMTNAGKEYVEQKSGKYYDLLPKGCDFDPDTVSVRTEKGELSESDYDISTVYNYNGTGRTLLVVNIKEQANRYTLTFSTTYSWDSILDYGKSVLNSVAYETGNDTISGGYPDDGGNIKEKKLLSDLDSSTDDKKFIYAQRTNVLDVLTTSTTGLTKKVKSSRDTEYTSDTIVKQSEVYSYKMRYSTTPISRAKNIIIYDTLENYNNDGALSDWHGTLQSVDISQPVDMGIAPIVYYSKIDDLNIDNHLDIDEVIDGEKVWLTESEIGDISRAKAIAVDLRYTSDGEEYTLDYNKSLTVVLYMNSPEKDETKVSDPTAYNNVFCSSTVIGNNGDGTDTLVHYNYTAVHYRVTSGFGIYKADSTDTENTPVKSISFLLDGTSDYGTGVYKILTTDKYGHIDFNNIEKGTYKLYEYKGNDDYQMISEALTVEIDGEGKVTIDGKPVGNDYYMITNDPRIHSNIEFYKKDYVKKSQTIQGATFKLAGKSEYGNDIVMYAESDETGRVFFENVELGEYTMVETATDEKHILSDIIYTVRVDDNANYAISDSFFEKDGTITVYNEPYHSFTISKIGYTFGTSVEGAKFSLKGTSNYETEVDQEVTIGANGQAVFSGLEPGDYMLQEIFTPEGYVLDDTKRIVTIEKDGTVTIEGIDDAKGTGADPFVIKNKEAGTVTITKKWYDDSDNANRPLPVVNISSEVPEQAAYFKQGEPNNGITINGVKCDRSILVETFGASNIKAFMKGDEATAKDKIQNNVAKRIDDGSTKYKIYAWLDNGTVYWWSDAQKVYMTDASHNLFTGLDYCETIDLSGINTSKVTTMSAMFGSCSKLTEVKNLNELDTSNVTDMSGMFYFCMRLTELDVSGFDTSNVTNMTHMFYECFYLTSLDVSSFDTSNVTDMSYMFYYCQVLTSLDVSSFNTSNVTSMDCMFYVCAKLTELDVSNFDTSNVTSMSCMFYNCKALTSLDLNSFNTSKVTSMYYMFYHCESLTSLDVSNFDTSKVTNMSSMFYYCSKLTELDVSKFNTSNVTNMYYMFYYCQALTSLDVSNFDTSNVTDMSGMFYHCQVLTSLDVSSFNTSNVTNMSFMFRNCKALTSLNVSNFDTSKVTDMSYMFDNCSKVTSLDVSKFNTSNVTNMLCMFRNCQALTSLDLSSFNTSNVTSMYYMFYNCSKLRKIYVSDLWNTSKVTSSSSMFSSCTQLVGGNGTKFSSSNKTDKTYARIDTAESPGYFTYKAAPTKAAPTSVPTALPTATFGSAFVLPVVKLSKPATSVSANEVITLVDSSASAGKISFLKAEKTTGKIIPLGVSGSKSYNFKSPESGTFENGILANEHCTVEQVDENTWTFTFTGLDPKLPYYVWEDDLDGYTISNDITNSLEVKDGKGTITNTTTQNPPTFGSLSVKKILKGDLNDADKSRTFLFTVTLTDRDGNALSGNKIYGETVFKDGVAKIRLADGESLIFTDIPTGYNYKVEETVENGFEMSDENAEGTISADSTVSAIFTNTKTFDETNTTSFKLKKIVSGNFEINTEKYKFIVALEGLQSKKEYTLSDGTTFTSDRNGSANVTVELGNGEEVAFRDIPVGASYRITEPAGKYTSSYVITDSNNLGLINTDRNSNVEENKALSTALETADSDEDITVTFTNKKFVYQDLVLKKLVTNTSVVNSDTFDFSVDFSNLNSFAIINSSLGKLKADSDGALTVEFSMSANETVTFYDLPVGTEYQIRESESDYTASYIIQDTNNLGQINGSYGENLVKNKSLSTEKETVNEGEEATVTFTNKKSECDIKVTKHVDMTYGNTDSVAYQSQEFQFSVDLNGLESSKKYLIEYTESDTTGSTEEVFYSESDGTKTLELLLKDGQSFTIKNLPVGTTYTITENGTEHYISSYMVECNEGAEIAKMSDNNTSPSESMTTAQEIVDSNDLDVEFIFTNTFTASGYTLPNSGMENDTLRLVLSMLGVVIFGMIYFVTKHKAKNRKISIQ